MLYENTASYTPDFAAEIDTEEEILADELGVSLKQSRAILAKISDAVRRNESLTLARAIGLMLNSSNLRVTVRCMAIAVGLDQIAGDKKTQSDVARELGVTRALISHYVLGIRDIFSGKAGDLDCFKFRKSNASREVYRKQATDPFLAAKREAKEQRKNSNKNEPNN